MNCLFEGREEGNSLLDSGWRKSEQEAVLISYLLFFIFIFLSDFFRSVFSSGRQRKIGQAASQSINRSAQPTVLRKGAHLPACPGRRDGMWLKMFILLVNTTPFQFILPIGYEASGRKGGGRKHGNPIRNLSADDTPAVEW